MSHELEGADGARHHVDLHRIRLERERHIDALDLQLDSPARAREQPLNEKTYHATDSRSDLGGGGGRRATAAAHPLMRFGNFSRRGEILASVAVPPHAAACAADSTAHRHGRGGAAEAVRVDRHGAAQPTQEESAQGLQRRRSVARTRAEMEFNFKYTWTEAGNSCLNFLCLGQVA